MGIAKKIFKDPEIKEIGNYKLQFQLSAKVRTHYFPESWNGYFKHSVFSDGCQNKYVRHDYMIFNSAFVLLHAGPS